MKKYMMALALGALVLTGCDGPFGTDDSGDDSHRKPSTVKTPAPKTSIIPGQRAPIRTTTRRR